MEKDLLETVIIYNLICCIEMQEYVNGQQYLSLVLHKEGFLGAYKIITSCNRHENILKVKKYFGYKQVTGGKETNSNMN